MDIKSLFVCQILILISVEASQSEDPWLARDNSTTLGYGKTDKIAGTHDKRSLAAVLFEAVAGPSLKITQMAASQGYSRSMVMRVKNYLKFPLVKPSLYSWYGKISHPPVIIRPCVKEAFTTHKTAHKASGTSGIASWTVPEFSVTIMVLFDVPYGSSYCNHLSIAVFKTLPRPLNDSNKNVWFNSLYDGSKAVNQYLTKHRYCTSGGEICQEGFGVKVCGIMAASRNSEAELRVEPTANIYSVTQNTCKLNRKVHN